jgi:long-chain acyl-CoA synthetase
VVGVPDERTGEAVVAYLRAAGDRSTWSTVEQRARQTCERRLARFKQPVRIEVVSQLPRTVTGKVAKGRLRDTLRRRGDGLLE